MKARIDAMTVDVEERSAMWLARLVPARAADAPLMRVWCVSALRRCASRSPWDDPGCEVWSIQSRTAPRAAAVWNLFSSGASALLAVAEVEKFERTEAG
jgi:hypothetical protein